MQAAAGSASSHQTLPLKMNSTAEAACNMLGAYCGARYAMKGGSKRVRGMIFVVLGLLFIKMGYELLF